jgi:sugar lactone lactonase YvrE
VACTAAGLFAAATSSACGATSAQSTRTTHSESEQHEAVAMERLSAPLVVKDVGFMAPECVLYDAERDLYLVSNVQGSALDADDQAFISRLKPDGSLDALKWIDSAQPDVALDAPKGMALSGQVLYVADITHVRKFDRKSGAPLGSIRIQGATFLNDVAVDGAGNVLASDSGISTGFAASGTDAVYRIDRNDQVTPIVRGTELGGPNGLLAAAGELWVVTFVSGELYKLGSDGQRSDVLKLPKGTLDGIVASQNGTLVSSWEGSAVYRMESGGPVEVVSGVNSPADIGFDTKRNRVLIPLFNDDAVMIHQL